jgi:hypothetical protein
MKKISITVIILAFLYVSLSLVGCGGKPDQAGSPEAASLLADVSQAMSSVSSYRMTGSISMGPLGALGDGATTDLQGEEQIVNGEVRMHMTTTESVGGQTIKIESYAIGQQQYMRIGNRVDAGEHERPHA